MQWTSAEEAEEIFGFSFDIFTFAFAPRDATQQTNLRHPDATVSHFYPVFQLRYV